MWKCIKVEDTSYTWEKLVSEKSISGKLDKNQGTANAGKILVVGTDGNLMLIDMPETGVVTGSFDESNNIILTGDLPNGTYTLKFKDAGGNLSDAGTIVVGAVDEEAPSEPTNFADPTSADWKTGVRLTTNIDQTTELTGGVATNYIAVQNGDSVTCEGIDFEDTNNRIAHANGADGENIHGIGKASVYATTNVTNGYFADVTYDSNSITLTVTCNTTAMRFSGLATGTSADVVVNIKRNGEWL